MVPMTHPQYLPLVRLQKVVETINLIVYGLVYPLGCSIAGSPVTLQIMGYNGVHPVSTTQIVGFGIGFPKKLLKCLFVKRLRTEVDVKEGFDYELIPVLVLYVSCIGYAFQVGSLLLGVNLRLLFYASMECVYMEVVNVY